MQDINKGYEKLIQVLLSLQFEPHEVIEAVNAYIDEETANKKSWVVQKMIRSQQMNFRAKEFAKIEALVCHFVYTYLLFNISNNFKLLAPDITNRHAFEL